MGTLDVMLGSYPHTEALKSGRVRSDSVVLNIADVTSAPSAFRQVLDLKYDIAELSVPTFLIARSKAVPLVMLPADLFKRAKPPELIYDAAKGRLSARDLKGKRVGVAYYTATTSIWMQCLIGNAGIDPATIHWIATEDPLVGGFPDPPNVHRATAKTLSELLQRGEVDAIVTVNPPPQPQFKAIAFRGCSPIKPFPDMQSHHMLVCKASLIREQPEAVRDVWRMLLESRAIALGQGHTDLPYGLDANRSQLERVAEACFKLGMIDHRPMVDDLFDEVTAALPASV